jgi:release factor glutamine methyltransferase
MPKVGEVYEEALKKAKEKGLLSSDIRVLIAHDEGFGAQIDVIFNKDKEMRHPVLFSSQMERLEAGEPVEYIINEATFLDRKLYVNEDVLIPRGETEELVSLITERVRDYFDPRNYLAVADIGTGSGCIALSLKDAFPSWVITATDKSPKALKVAKRNFLDAGVQITTMEGDALKPLIDSKSKLDILVSNPPYILHEGDAQRSVIDYEPKEALMIDLNDNVYKSVFEECQKVRGGDLLMFFEISPDLRGYLEDLMEKTLKGYTAEFVKDLNGNDRFLIVYLREGGYAEA